MAPVPLRLRMSAPPGRAGGAPAPYAAGGGDPPSQNAGEDTPTRPSCLPSHATNVPKIRKPSVRVFDHRIRSVAYNSATRWLAIVAGSGEGGGVRVEEGLGLDNHRPPSKDVLRSGEGVCGNELSASALKPRELSAPCLAWIGAGTSTTEGDS